MNKHLKELTVISLMAIVIALSLNKFVCFLTYVPTASMEPTIKVKDRVLVRVVYDTSKLKRGDILTFYSKEEDSTLIKRLVGLPGDVIRLTDDKVSVNGEYLDNISLDIESEFHINKTYVVPEDCFFFLGDNRNDSFDSRFWENSYINKEDITGKALLRFSSLSDIEFFR